MENFTQKYCIVAFLETVDEGHEYSYTSWPLHVTLADVFDVHCSKEALIAAFKGFLPDQKSAHSEAMDDTFFGQEKNIQVTLLQKSESLLSLHKNLLAELANLDAVFNDPQYMGEGFTPHVTVQRHARVHKNESLRVTSLSLIDMYHLSDGYHRNVLKTTHLLP